MTERISVSTDKEFLMDMDEWAGAFGSRSQAIVTLAKIGASVINENPHMAKLKVVK